MISLTYLFEENKQEVIKKEFTKNWDIDVYKKPDKDKIIGWRAKKFDNKNGEQRMLKLALIKDPDTGKTKTQATSLWRKKTVEVS